jgi:hypothetical protein
MATQKPITHTFKAGGDLSAKQYHFVKMSADQTVVACTAVTDKAIGILQNDPDAAGEDAVVAIAGTSKLYAGAAYSFGINLGPKADGRGQTAVSTQFTRAISVEAAGADGDIVEVLLIQLTAMA